MTQLTEEVQITSDDTNKENSLVERDVQRIIQQQEGVPSRKKVG